MKNKSFWTVALVLVIIALFLYPWGQANPTATGAIGATNPLTGAIEKLFLSHTKIGTTIFYDNNPIYTGTFNPA